MSSLPPRIENDERLEASDPDGREEPERGRAAKPERQPADHRSTAFRRALRWLGRGLGLLAIASGLWFARDPLLAWFLLRPPERVPPPVPADEAEPARSRQAVPEGHDRSAHVSGGDAIAYYTCSMHPSVQQEAPGTCPICSMDLTPVTREELETGVLRVDEERRQLIGVKTQPVGVQSLERTIRAAGKVTYAESRLEDVVLRFGGYISELKIDSAGQFVEKGQVLLTIYSPELYTAQQEYLLALQSQRSARKTGAPDRANYLVRAAEKRLELWDLSPGQIRQIAKTGRPLENFPILSPVSGFVMEKGVVAGAAVTAGQRLYRIADLSRVWIEAEIYESELPLISVGQKAKVTLPYVPDRSFSGTVGFLYPYLDVATRAGRVRIELDNPKDARGDFVLRPDMYANVVLGVSLGERLVVPEEAILYAGRRRLVFVDLGEGRLEPREIQVGQKAGDAYVVESGLEPGEQVVTSGNFLIAAESRLKSATERW